MNFETLLGDKRSKVSVQSLFMYVFGIVFELPAMLWGDHWTLEEDEAGELGKASKLYIDSLPKRQKAKWEAAAFEHFPRLIFFAVLLLIVLPKLKMQAEVMRERRQQRLQAHGQRPNPGDGAEIQHADSRPGDTEEGQASDDDVKRLFADNPKFRM